MQATRKYAEKLSYPNVRRQPGLVQAGPSIIGCFIEKDVFYFYVNSV